jgi:nucleotide-binding universal stress UspA family protein
MIYLLHVVEDLRSFGSEYIDDIPHEHLDRFQEEAAEAAKKSMDRVCDEQLQSCPNFQRNMVSGDPATEILKVIDSERIDLVIMGTHGRKGLEHVIFGSVAENVVKKSPVPVLTINPYRVP